MAYGFEFEKDGYHFVSVEKESGTSEITISKNGKVLKRFPFPSYKIWNIPAHAEDIIAGLEKENDSGLLIAGSDGLGGNYFG